MDYKVLKAYDSEKDTVSTNSNERCNHATTNSQNYKLKQRVIFVCTPVFMTDEQKLGGKNLITNKKLQMIKTELRFFSASLPLGFRLGYL